jgi:heme/copper-type cytochrome/quinol oxidase subunit 1
MHRLPSHTTLRRFRIASLLVLFMYLSVPMAFGFLCFGFVSGEDGCLAIAGIVVAAGLVCMILSFIMSSRLRCPLCMMPPLQTRRCSKHKSAATLFNSHRLSVAQSILFKDSFRCPYCGEPTAMEVRERRRR